MNWKLITTFVFTLFVLQSFAQKAVFNGKLLKNAQHPSLSEQFTKYEVYEIDATTLNAFAKSGAVDVDFKLKLGSQYDWDFSITPHDIRGDNYVLSIQTNKGVKDLPRSENKTFRGALQGSTNSVIALTLDTDFIYGFVKTGQEYVFIEPAWYFNAAAPKNQFVVYNGQNVVSKDGTCGAMELASNKASMKHRHNHDHESEAVENVNKSVLACYEVELAIASDAAMFASYNTVVNVENHNIAVKNNVETDYDTDFFTHEIQFLIVQQFVVTNGNNPWPNGTGSPDAGDYLTDFRLWGQGGGFSVSYDLASLWTGLDLAGSTIGVAYVGAVCGSFRYNLLQDFTSNANLKRVLVSHEYGHNFNSNHDNGGDPFIMAPSVQNTATWSAQSINSIDNFVAGLISGGCLSTCGPPIPPT
ncbi:MAG: hypothetical protein ACI9LN_004394, partial [Saprospiraceae bacterium]